MTRTKISREPLKPLRCDLCGGTRSEPYGPSRDRRNPPEMLKCTSCGLVFTGLRPEGDSLKDLYKEYYDESEIHSLPKTKEWGPSLKQNLFLRRLYHGLFGNYMSEILSRSRGRVLDVGCGKGLFMEELRRLGRDPFGVEPNPDAALLCQKKGLSVVQGLFGEADFADQFFSTIVFFHSLEHLPSPKTALQEAFRILKPGGRTFIYCPNVESYMADLFGRSWGGWQLPFHLYHFSLTTMRMLALSARFSIVRIKAVTPDFIFHKYVRDHVAARQKEPGETRMLRLVKLFPFRLTTAMIFRCMDLALPRKGECLQVELEKTSGGGGR